MTSQYKYIEKQSKYLQNIIILIYINEFTCNDQVGLSMPQSSKKKKDKKKDKQKCVELAPAVEETREETLLCLITEQSEEATSLGRCVGNVKKILQSSIAQPVPEVGPCGQREILEGLMALLPEDMAQVGNFKLVMVKFHNTKKYKDFMV